MTYSTQRWSLIVLNNTKSCKEVDMYQEKEEVLEAGGDYAWNSSHGDVSGDWVDVGHIASEEIPAEIKLNAETASSAWMNVLPERMVAALYELLADFTEEAVPEPQLTEDETLSVNRLKDNIRRFKSNSEPIFDSIQGVRSLLRWKNPAATFLTFVVYMYAVYIGWLLPVALFLLLFRLFVNYLSSKGWDLNVQYFRETERQKAKDGDSFSDMGVSDKFSVVVQVAKQVQNKLGHIADTLEKFKNLLMWKQPAASLNLFLVLLIAFIASCFLPGQTLFTVGGILLGIKLYIIEYIYVRFPRFKQRHDSVARMWRELPTDRELENRYQKAAINRNLVISRSEVTLPKEVSAPEHDFQFCEVFNLPPSETPKTESDICDIRIGEWKRSQAAVGAYFQSGFDVEDWVGGRRCTLIDKDKSWTSAIQYGRLFLTHSFLCFERLPVNKKSVSSNVMIALKDITSIVRSKPYWLLPGPGMSIDICVSGFEKPYVFGTILNRDETYANIVNHAKKVELPWAMDVATEAVATETDAPVDNTDGGAGLSFRMSTLKEKESGDEDEMGRNLDLLVDL
ncbi:hypothetical protein CAPTEDRAFT_226159 [Capitella teleta]|uniref:GRAM domain-containing protein n=1 Tax=Capitella teleta TaxID=283909 RepID=R7TTL8_CAPTE|nr:hypothetical protein CAPTEDRAFT_226159 [Capitella teleta]|eukprot:ELT94791.1 hypothetical protein CAPTEDRAFT_226159 [Capitella teleta]